MAISCQVPLQLMQNFCEDCELGNVEASPACPKIRSPEISDIPYFYLDAHPSSYVENKHSGVKQVPPVMDGIDLN